MQQHLQWWPSLLLRSTLILLKELGTPKALYGILVVLNRLTLHFLPLLSLVLLLLALPCPF